MKTYLAFPPHWALHSPPLAPALLCSVLRAAGHEVLVRDLNLQAYRILLSREWLGESRRQSEKLVDRLSGGSGRSKAERHKLSYILTRMPAFPFVLAHAEEADQRIRQPEGFYDLAASQRQMKVIELALQLALLPYYPTALVLDTLRMPYSFFSTRQVMEACLDRSSNPFIPLYERYVMPEILDFDCRLLGLTINSHNQVVPGLTLARLVKQQRPETHVCVGGSFFTKVAEAITPEHFRWVDSFVVHEGERAIVELCSSLEGGNGPARVCNLICLDRQGRVVRGAIEPLRNLDEFPDPDFDQYRLSEYLAPEPALPVISSRGCYFARCSFCGSPSVLLKKYASVSAPHFARMIQRLHQRYGARFFTFMDEAVSPRFLKEFSAATPRLSPSGGGGGSPGLRFTAEIRLERAFSDPAFIRKLSQAGFSTVLIGLESLSERIQRLIGKGIDLATVREIVHLLVEQGLSVHLFLIAGYPTETPSDFEGSLTAILELGCLQRDPFSSYAYHAFALERGSAMNAVPNRFGIHHVVRDADEDLAICFRYEGVSPDPEESENRARFARAHLARMLGRACFMNPYHTMFYKDHYRRQGLTDAEVLLRLQDPRNRGGRASSPHGESALTDDLVVEAQSQLDIKEHGGHIYTFEPANVELGHLGPLEGRILLSSQGRARRLGELISEMTASPDFGGTTKALIHFALHRLIQQRLLRIRQNP